MNDKQITALVSLLGSIVGIILNVIFGYEAIKAIISIIQTQTVTYWDAFWIVVALGDIFTTSKINNKENK